MSAVPSLHLALENVHHQLPFETIENIAAFFWNDTIALLHCTLVCQTWYIAARPLIFRRVVVKSPERFAELEMLLLADPTIGYWVRELYVDGSLADPLLNRSWIFGSISGSKHDTSCVQLDQASADDLECGVACGGARESTSNSYRHLDLLPGAILADRLKRLNALTFAHVRTTHPHLSANLIRSISRVFGSSVRSLSFKSCWGHEGFFLAFLHAFPHVHEMQSIGTRTLEYGPHEWQLELEEFKKDFLPFLGTCTAQSHLSRGVRHTNFYLSSLRIDHHDFVHDSLICLPSLRTVHTLEINHTGHRLHPIDDISNKILPECGRALRTLRLSLNIMPERSRTCNLFT